MAAKFGRRLRRGAASGVVAALAVAALTASQAPDAATALGGSRDTPRGDTPIDGGSSYYTDLPPLVASPPGKDDGGSGPIATGPEQAGIPATVLDAYKKAEASLARTHPGCNLPWQLLAAIGRVESGQARGGAVDAHGTTLQPILGPQLNGNGFARIADTDGGRFDNDVTHDRAVGPMQFIPSTWAVWGTDANGDGARDPNNVYDAALSAGRYLCAGGRDLSVQADMNRAILGYNHSEEYLRTVLSWYEYYRKGTHEVPDGTGILPTGPRGSGSGDRTTDKDKAGKDAARKASDGGKDRKGGSGKDAGTGQDSGAGRDTSADQDSGKGTDKGSGADSGTGSGGSGGDDATKPDPAPAPGGDGSGTDSGSGSDGTDSGTAPGSGTESPTKPPAPSKPAPLASLERTGEKERTATAGETFADRLQVRAKDTKGGTVSGVKVQYEIRGDGDTRFEGGAAKATVTTDKDGLATAPALIAGKKAGTYTVRATAVDRAVPATDFTVTVKAKPQADALARTSDGKMQAAKDASYAEPVEVKATYRGKAAADVPVTATVIAGDAADPAKAEQSAEGPYFKDAKGAPVRTLTGLKTDADGLLTLPKLFTDSHPGTYKLRLTTADGALLVLDLTVG
ncbi:lytic transglycosylase [Streptomyces sp. Ru73]|uniref:lytic transglycosylase domain-containing protein n=1 Tax=Streptomyces sp. Ru73 TaxID=2080748 RepID=UPI000CDDBC5B|nr:lytic murein transglycosylase [Streptomyces sp. Ru73]POX40366.1 lytic transglycosylase [Streptomyces sp. Ru73]